MLTNDRFSRVLDAIYPDGLAIEIQSDSISRTSNGVEITKSKSLSMYLDKENARMLFQIEFIESGLGSTMDGKPDEMYEIVCETKEEAIETYNSVVL